MERHERFWWETMEGSASLYGISINHVGGKFLCFGARVRWTGNLLPVTKMRCSGVPWVKRLGSRASVRPKEGTKTLWY